MNVTKISDAPLCSINSCPCNWELPALTGEERSATEYRWLVSCVETDEFVSLTSSTSTYFLERGKQGRTLRSRGRRKQTPTLCPLCSGIGARGQRQLSREAPACEFPWFVSLCRRNASFCGVSALSLCTIVVRRS